MLHGTDRTFLSFSHLFALGRVFTKDGVEVLVDEISLDLLRGSTLDYEQDLMRSAFQIVNNPNSDSSCGCGVSFSPKDM